MRLALSGCCGGFLLQDSVEPWLETVTVFDGKSSILLPFLSRTSFPFTPWPDHIILQKQSSLLRWRLLQHLWTLEEVAFMESYVLCFPAPCVVVNCTECSTPGLDHNN